MDKLFILFLSISIFFCFCDKDVVKNNEVENEIHVTSQSYEVFVQDTCTYTFIVDYLNQYNSVEIMRILLGYNIIITKTDEFGSSTLLDSLNRISESSVFSISGYNSTYEICYTGKISSDSAKSIINNIDGINFKELQRYNKNVWIKIKDSEQRDMIFNEEFVTNHNYLCKD